ncbi:hypothetical protein [Solimicrobium silvestre]|uniref:Uncharacterized protein n=1 Tax=Solimicrobium silvestre TaxID=2099400 RepID=A0A2S9GYQ6_9BURK|nr:hypothetical protein [Solimicrobium silvestre]PRC92843.1 hypothetical protein S2091_2573 [Solimicrobium silvestre]
MQTQPGQLLNALGNTLNWHGDGYTVSGQARRPTELALLQGIRHSAMLAFVDEEPELISRWIWLERAQPQLNTDLEWRLLDSLFQIDPAAGLLRVGEDGQFFQANKLSF